MIVPNKIFVIGNWKTKPGTRTEALALAKKITPGSSRKVEVVLAPPALFLADIQETLSVSCAFSTQDIYQEETGAQNAEMSPTQAKSVGCDYALVGHSSRRALGETDALVNAKIKACIENDIIPIVCIGESVRDTNGAYITFLQNQIRNSFAGMNKAAFEHIIIAYEPLWAIGAEATRDATAAEAEEVRILIQKTIDEMTGHIPVGRITIIYGGSVDTPQHIKDFLSCGMQGVLVGRASLQPELFNSLITTANTHRI